MSNAEELKKLADSRETTALLFGALFVCGIALTWVWRVEPLDNCDAFGCEVWEGPHPGCYWMIGIGATGGILFRWLALRSRRAAATETRREQRSAEVSPPSTRTARARMSPDDGRASETSAARGLMRPENGGGEIGS